MSTLTLVLSQQLDRPVVDKTELLAAMTSHLHVFPETQQRRPGRNRKRR